MKKRVTGAVVVLAMALFAVPLSAAEKPAAADQNPRSKGAEGTKAAIPGPEEKKEPEIDYAAAFRQMKPLAEKGDIKAQVQVAYLYYTGKGVKQDYREAATWFKKAAEKGNATAEVNLAKMYATGTGVGQDDKEAARLFRKAANKKHPDAQISLGLAYFLGKGVPKDGRAAYMWVSLAAEQGHELAKKIIGQIASEITPAEREAGVKLAKEWKPEKQ